MSYLGFVGVVAGRPLLLEADMGADEEEEGE